MNDHENHSTPDSSRSDHSTRSSAETYASRQTLSEFELFEYYPEENTYRAFYDATLDPPSTAVVSAVAAVSDTEPTEMSSLYAAIDTDALDALASSRRTAAGDLHVTFEFHGHEVTVSDYGCITIHPHSPTGM